MYEQKIRSMNINDLKMRMKRKDRAFMLMDAREVEAFDKGHIPGSCNMFDGELMSMAKDFDKNMEICVYGPGQATPSSEMADRMSGDAAKKLMDMGFKNITTLNGGYEAWANSGNRIDASMRKNV